MSAVYYHSLLALDTICNRQDDTSWLLSSIRNLGPWENNYTSISNPITDPALGQTVFHPLRCIRGQTVNAFYPSSLIPILRNVSGDKVISASPSLGLCFMCNGIPGPDGSGQATLTRLSPMAPAWDGERVRVGESGWDQLARPRIVTPDLYCTRVQCVQWTWCVLYSLRLTAVVNGCRILTLRGCRSQSVAASRSRPQLWLARLSLSRALASAGRDLTEATSSVLHHQPPSDSGL